MINLRTRALALLFAAGWLGCSESSGPGLLRVVEVRATRDDSVELGAVTVHVGDDPPRRADVAGSLRLELPVSRGRVRVGVACPQGFRAAEPRSVDLRHGAPQTPLRVTFVCRPLLRSVALAVHAPFAEGHAVLVDGEPVGIVGADGTFHGLLARAPGASLRVAVDPAGLLLDAATSDVTLADRDELVVLTPSLRAPVPAPLRARTKRRAPRPAVHVPYAIRRTHG